MPGITRLVVNGCSFTDDRSDTTWATELASIYPELDYYNIASSAAGNDYICQSTIDFLEHKNFDPATTAVIVMWSGTGRKDITISGEWWYHLIQSYPHGRNIDENYWLFSGGTSNSWTTNATTRKIFEWYYKLSDPHTICKNSLNNFLHLENYLRIHSYPYLCTSYVNYWDSKEQSNSNGGDYSIGFFCQTHALFKHYDFSNWFFVNDSKDCLGEFARDRDQLDATGHPTSQGHSDFVAHSVIPQVSHLFN
jgi:hypothetical protein